MDLEFTVNELAIIAKKIISLATSKTLCFYGEMGAGKTSLISTIVRELEGADAASSPTFGLVNEYHTSSGMLLGYHFDFYRIEEEEEALDLGLEDYFYQDVWVFIEWPEKVTSLLPENCTTIRLSVVNEHKRRISLLNS